MPPHFSTVPYGRPLPARVLCSSVVALSHALGGIMGLPEPSEHVRQADPLA